MKAKNFLLYLALLEVGKPRTVSCWKVIWEVQGGRDAYNGHVERRLVGAAKDEAFVVFVHDVPLLVHTKDSDSVLDWMSESRPRSSGGAVLPEPTRR